MSLEVRQMVIRSTVMDRREDSGEHKGGAQEPLDVEELKASILSECRQAIRDALREHRDR